MNIDLVRENIQAARNQLRYVRGQEGIVANIEDRLISALRLLGDAPPPETRQVLHHKDGDPLNNSFSNLEVRRVPVGAK